MAPKERRSLEPWLLDSVDFYQHQIDGVRECAKRRSFLQGDDMGLGKTLQVLALFAVDVNRGWGETMLVIVPKSIKFNWVDEIRKFTRFPFVALEGSPDKRMAQFVKFMTIIGPKILIITYEEAFLHREELSGFRFDIAVYDEAHYIKNPMARRTKAVLELNSRRSFMVTGTPMLNRIDELWCLLHRIDPDKYPNYWLFVNRYGVYGGNNNRDLVGVKNEKELKRRVGEVMIRRKKSDVLDLPEVQIITRKVTLHPEQRELYDRAFEDLKITRIDELEDEELENALTKFLRLKQICGSTKPFTGDDISAKLDMATQDDVEILENGHKIVVFTQFREIQEIYNGRMKAILRNMPLFSINGDTSSKNRQAAVRAWTNTQGPAIFCSMLQVASEGINLTAARHAGFLDKWFTPGRNRQAIDRLHRIGQSNDETQAVQIREYITRGTVEMRIEQILNRKTKLVEQVIGGDAQITRDRKLLKMIMEGSGDD